MRSECLMIKPIFLVLNGDIIEDFWYSLKILIIVETVSQTLIIMETVNQTLISLVTVNQALIFLETVNRSFTNVL